MTMAPDHIEHPAEGPTKPPMYVLMVQPRPGHEEFVRWWLDAALRALSGPAPDNDHIVDSYGPFAVADELDRKVYNSLGWHGDGHDNEFADEDLNITSRAVRHAAREMVKTITQTA